MKGKIDSHFGIAVLALVAACVGFALLALTKNWEITDSAPDAITTPAQKAVPTERAEIMIKEGTGTEGVVDDTVNTLDGAAQELF